MFAPAFVIGTVLVPALGRARAAQLRAAEVARPDVAPLRVEPEDTTTAGPVPLGRSRGLTPATPLGRRRRCGRSDRIDQTGRMPPPLAPGPSSSTGGASSRPDVDGIDARLQFDLAGRQATGEALIRFTAGDETGHPALDLRQPIEWLRLDGDSLTPDAFAPVDVGAGPGSEVRVLDVTLEAGSPHRLEVGYPLETPEATASEPITWADGGVRFDLWMSDLHPGRYLEMWVPAPLIHDRFRSSSISRSWAMTAPMR